MRPAQLTPENVRGVGLPERRKHGFNEAGAINAGKHGTQRYNIEIVHSLQ